ncbi:SLATT domain-containing protein [Belliella calami]|nr:SLATT domain-containing protein [Belliella calami]
MDKDKVIAQWTKGLRIRHIAHSISFSYYHRIDRIIGLLSTLISAMVATAIFSSFAQSESRNIIIIAGAVSVLATLLSAAAAFLKYGELAERHNNAVAQFGSLRRELETMVMNETILNDNMKFQEINTKWSELEKSSPAIPSKIYRKASDRISQSGQNT